MPSLIRFCSHAIAAIAVVVIPFANSRRANAAEAIQITAENYASVVPRGKEVDAIIGDWVLRNGHITSVIAQPAVGRKANMTVRGVGGTVIDLTTRSNGSDQLSCFYPAGGRFLFEQAETLQIRCDGFVRTQQKVYQGKEVALVVAGKSIAGPELTANVRILVRDGEHSLRFETTVTNATDRERSVHAEAMLRCDGDLFRKSVLDDSGCYLADDAYFQQSYAFSFEGSGLVADNARGVTLRSAGDWPQKVPAGESVTWKGALFCSQGKPSAVAWAEARSAERQQRTPEELVAVTLRLRSSKGSCEHAKIAVTRAGDSPRQMGEIQADEKGYARLRLAPAKYTLKIVSAGRPLREHAFEVEAKKPLSDNISLPNPSRLRAKIVDDLGRPIPAKVQLVAKQGGSDPDFGPTSAITAVKNLIYTANGTFTQEVDPGDYLAIVSHGNEYDAAFLDISIVEGRITDLESALKRSVDTRGWVSTEYHSHSSPSGDNVSHQTGRVLNLLAENIEFAPCTEHNRIDTYADDLALLNATALMATCTGMELTGGPLPINHQNAFPLVRHEHTQDGGGPQTDLNPVKQIERLALWDQSSEKVVQTNHPNIPQILGDQNLDGVPDEGFRGMLGWMDVIEIHPPQAIFQTPAKNIAPKDKSANRMFAWMQLLNLGYRIPGVVNTDAHYNFHGSGWLRNYVMSSTDDPAEISVSEMVKATERGNIVMTTGPFLEVGITEGAEQTGRMAIAGDDINGNSHGLYVRVQCPNWFDINRVQIFANGRALAGANFTRRTHPNLFHQDAVRFEHMFQLPKFDVDTHIIVATIGEGLQLGRVMGPEQGKLPPVAVSNPIFIDVDSNGFVPNGDDLGVPTMVPHDHPHPHDN